jgi:hypothetical protein
VPSFTPTPSVTPSPSPTVVGSFAWLLDDTLRLNTVFVPRAGSTFVHPHRGRDHSLDLQDSASRFCTQAGLFPQLRLDLNPGDCENQCFIGIFPQDSTSSAHIARMPALNRPIGTFDVLVETVVGCERGRPPTIFRMPAAVTYTAQSDCDGDGAVRIDELMLGVRISLGHEPVTTCLPQDLDNNGVLQIHELIGAVFASLEGG